MAHAEQQSIDRQLEAVLHALEAVQPEQASSAMKSLAAPAQQLTRLRNDVIAMQRGGAALAPQDLLPRLNQLVSVMASLEYPLAGIHWKRIEGLRKALRSLMDAVDSG